MLLTRSVGEVFSGYAVKIISSAFPKQQIFLKVYLALTFLLIPTPSLFSLILCLQSSFFRIY